MSKVAVMMSENSIEAPMSSHFGKANWVMTADTETHTSVFMKIEAANGRSVADLLASQGCTDVVVGGIGNGALACLQATGIRGWMAPPNLNGQQALRMFEHLRLRPAVPQSEGHSSKGCCCTKETGTKTDSCCHGASTATA